MNNNLIFDFETFGNDVTEAAIINCAMMVFDWERFEHNPYTWEELVSSVVILKLDVQEQVTKYGYKIHKSDLDWWSGLDPEVRNQIKPTTNDLTLNQFCGKIIDELRDKNVKSWWSRGNTFDPLLLERCFKDVGQRETMKNFLKFWRVRDIRTYFDTRFDFDIDFDHSFKLQPWSDIFLQHNSIQDVAADILRMQFVERILKGLE